MSTVASPVVLADAISLPKIGARTRAIVLVVGFAALTALLSQIRIYLGFTPVPITGGTFAVLLAGAALGSRLGALSQITYVVAGLFLPVYGNAQQGWDFFTGTTGGYLVGYIVAAFIVGKLAERREDRSFLTAISAMVLGSVIVYVPGVIWLAHVANMSTDVAIAKGAAPFILGDGVKALLAGAVLPATWALVNRK
jgi:biotin transport system substrate-specific component